MIEEFETIKILLQKMNEYNITNEELQYLQFLLLKNEPTFRYCYPVSKIKILEDKIIVMSDTHFGGPDENRGLVYTSYNTALQKNIKTAIHAGDLTEACANNQFNKKIEIIREELNLSLAYMPDEIKTKLLISNHDYSAIRTYPEIIPEYFKNPKLEILGMKKALLNWNNALISVNHKISQIKNFETEEAAEIMKLYGHFHGYSLNIKERTITLPPLCHDSFDQTKNALAIYGLSLQIEDIPSFLIISKQDEEVLLFEFYSINRSTFALESKTKKLELNTKTKIIREYK